MQAPQIHLTANRALRTYEKGNKLRGVVSEVGSDLSAFVASIDGLRILSSFGQNSMKRLKKPLVAAALLPFLPRELLGIQR